MFLNLFLLEKPKFIGRLGGGCRWSDDFFISTEEFRFCKLMNKSELLWKSFPVNLIGAMEPVLCSHEPL